MRHAFLTRYTCLAVLAATLASGCVFRDVREQQASIDQNCVVEGTVASARAGASPIVVVLVRRVGDGDKATDWRVVDHFVLEGAGRWGFLSPPGQYRLAAFADQNRDLIYQPGEAFIGAREGRDITCAAGGRVKEIALAIPAVPVGRIETELDIAKLQARSIEGQVGATLGQLTVVGEQASLADARFSREVAEGALWRPFDFIVASYAGVYFLERDDAGKIPVLFVHGMNGTPASFAYLIERLDRARFQPWVYYYPSGVHLPRIADHLAQTIAKLQRRFPHDRMVVVAHSMGGLVSRGFLQRHAQAGGAPRIPLFVTMSTPWDGHRAAELGVKHAPAVVRIWEDMVPGSPYLKEIFARPLPAGGEHHLIFTFNRNASSFGVSDDQSVTVASQLAPGAQASAARIYGLDETHIGILKNAEASALLNRLLARVR